MHSHTLPIYGLKKVTSLFCTNTSKYKIIHRTREFATKLALKGNTTPMSERQYQTQAKTTEKSR